jgi:phospholipase C
MSLDRIDHFVVLMLENRSFDHIFGLRRGVDGLLDQNGVIDPQYSNSDPAGGSIAASGGAPFMIPTKHGLGPFHNLPDVNEQLFGSQTPAQGAVATMGGFVSSYREALLQDTQGNFTSADVAVVMQSFDVGSLPAISALADNFVLCDKWFSEVPGPTHPNRLYMHAGTSQGFAHNVFARPFDCLTIYELLQRNGQTWAVYEFDLDEVNHFTRIQGAVGNFRSFIPRFAQDVETSTLPNYAFIVPRFSSSHHAEANDQHAPHDVRWGEYLIADVYDAIRANDAIWNSCALIVTYDEHGGFYDHVPPPAAVNPDNINSPRPDDNFGHSAPPVFAFDRLGVRVPALIVSPWVAKGVVVSDQLQHTSILHTVRDRFGIAQALSQREAGARSLAAVFDQPAGRVDAPLQLPRPQLQPLPAPEHPANPGNEWPDSLVQEMLAGAIQATRPSHPEDDVVPPVVPQTQAAATALARRRWENHRRWLNTQ